MIERIGKMLESNIRAHRKPPRLSPRQWQVLEYLTRGYSNKIIANIMNLEVVTVKMHVGYIFKKLEVTNRTEAAVRGIQLYANHPASAVILPERNFDARSNFEARSMENRQM